MRCGLGIPLVTSVHGGDVLWTNSRVPGAAAAVERVLGGSALVLANSAGIERLAVAHGAQQTRVVHLGSDLPTSRAPPRTAADRPPSVTSSRASATRRPRGRCPSCRGPYLGDRRRAWSGDRSSGSRACSASPIAVEFAGQLAPAAAALRAREALCFVMPSTEEAFGVA